MATVWPHFVIGQSNDPLYRLIVEIATFCHHVIGPPNGPHSGCLVKSGVFALFCHSATKWSNIQVVKSAVFGPNFSVGQQMTPLQR